MTETLNVGGLPAEPV